jgi:thiamine-phosphate pyrophosphorylase
MTPDIYLIAPADAEPEALRRQLTSTVGRARVAALLLPRGTRAEGDYRALVKAVVPDAQAADIAVLIEGEPGLVRTLKADGLHVNGPLAAVREAVEALKPDLIVGAGGVRTRDEAMQKAEAGVDYILFGPLSGPISAAERDLARWWAETMEVPSVLSDPEADPTSYDAAGCEFIGLSVFAGAPVR